MTIVDTSVWIDLFRGTETLQTLWLQQNVRVVRIALTDLVLCEALQGIRTEALARKVHSEMTKFPVLSTSGPELAVRSARNYRFLRTRGTTIRSTIDCITATLCVENGHMLLHRDRDFDAFERHLGLQVIHPQTH